MPLHLHDFLNPGPADSASINGNVLCKHFAVPFICLSHLKHSSEIQKLKSRSYCGSYLMRFSHYSSAFNINIATMNINSD